MPATQPHFLIFTGSGVPWRLDLRSGPSDPSSGWSRACCIRGPFRVSSHVPSSSLRGLVIRFRTDPSPEETPRPSKSGHRCFWVDISIGGHHSTHSGEEKRFQNTRGTRQLLPNSMSLSPGFLMGPGGPAMVSATGRREASHGELWPLSMAPATVTAPVFHGVDGALPGPHGEAWSGPSMEGLPGSGFHLTYLTSMEKS